VVEIPGGEKSEPKEGEKKTDCIGGYDDFSVNRFLEKKKKERGERSASSATPPSSSSSNRDTGPFRRKDTSKRKKNAASPSSSFGNVTKSHLKGIDVHVEILCELRLKRGKKKEEGLLPHYP